MRFIRARSDDALRAVGVAACLAVTMWAVSAAAVAGYRRTLVDDAAARRGDTGRFPAADHLADVLLVLWVTAALVAATALLAHARRRVRALPPRDPDQPARPVPSPRRFVAGGGLVVWLVLALIFRAQVDTDDLDGVRLVYGFDVLVAALVAVLATLTGWLVVHPRPPAPPGRATSASR